jgi:hypothetical protein
MVPCDPRDLMSGRHARVLLPNRRSVKAPVPPPARCHHVHYAQIQVPGRVCDKTKSYPGTYNAAVLREFATSKSLRVSVGIACAISG